MANQLPGPDTITFNIPGDGVHNIIAPNFSGRLESKVIINGYTQPGSVTNTSTDPTVNNARITVNLINTQEHNYSACLVISHHASGSQIRGLGFFNNSENDYVTALELQGGTEKVTVDGCAFGATDGQARLRRAVYVFRGAHNTIGGDVAGTPALQNVMSNYGIGVEVQGHPIQGSASHNAIVGNLIGGQPKDPGDQLVGVLLDPNATHNTVVRNVLFKNTTAMQFSGDTNVVDPNTIVKR
jgi:hypothetical protein